MDTHRSEREARDASRTQAYASSARQEEFARDLNQAPQRQMNKASLAERSKYQFEADSEDEDMENEIDNNLDLLHGATGKLKGLALSMGKEVDEQNKHIDRIIQKVSFPIQLVLLVKFSDHILERSCGRPNCHEQG